MSFYDIYEKYREFDFDGFFHEVTPSDVLNVLSKDKLNDMDYLTLLSPAAEDYFEIIAQKAHRITVQNFGKVIFFFAPLYLANYCVNRCAYCSYNADNELFRRKLTMDEVEEEAKAIARTGLEHILILTGESRKYSPVSYIGDCTRVLRKYFSSVSIEVYPLDVDEYKELIDSGVDGLTLFQEVYNPVVYDEVHRGGPKKNYHYRLDAPERACIAGMRTVGIGALLGLDDWRKEAFFTGLHASYLQHRYWDVEISISLPRIRPHVGYFIPKAPVDDKSFVQILMADRLFLPRCGITISTRENPQFRENILPLGVTKMSAGSSTQVGGYAHPDEGTEQFEIADHRNVNEMTDMILNHGYLPIFQDWQ